MSLGSTTATNGAKKTYRLLNPIAENMEFSPVRPGGPYDIDRMLRDIDYTTTYKNVLGTSDMTAAGDFSKMIEPKTIHGKDYFHWLGATRHRYRFRHAFADGPEDRGEGLDLIQSWSHSPYHELFGIRNYVGSDHCDEGGEWSKGRRDNGTLRQRAWAVKSGQWMRELVNIGGMNMWGYIQLMYGKNKTDRAPFDIIAREQKLLNAETNVLMQADQLVGYLRTKNVKVFEDLIAKGCTIGITVDPRTGKVIGGELPSDVDPNDPEAIAKYCAKKLEEYKANVEAEYKKLNEKIDKLDALRKEYKERAEAMVTARLTTIRGFRDLSYWLIVCCKGRSGNVCGYHAGMALAFDGPERLKDLDFLRMVIGSKFTSGCIICDCCKPVYQRKGDYHIADHQKYGQKALLKKIGEIEEAIKAALEAEEKYIKVVKDGYGGGGGQ